MKIVWAAVIPKLIPSAGQEKNPKNRVRSNFIDSHLGYNSYRRLKWYNGVWSFFFLRCWGH